MEDQDKLNEALAAASQLLDKEDFLEAAKAYQAILDSGTNTGEVYQGLAKSLYGAGKYDEAAKAYQAILDSGTKTAEVYRGLGDSFCESGKYDESIAAFKEAISRDPDPETYDCLGDILYQLRRFQDAIENYEKAAAPFLDQATKAIAEAKAAEQCASEEKKKEARDKCAEAKKAFEEYADRCIDLGYCYLCLRDYDKAVEVLNCAIDKAGQYPLAYHALASVFWTQGNYKDARTQWTKAKVRYQNCESEILKKHWDGWLIYEGTLLHEVFGDLPEAKRVYEAALNINPNIVSAWTGLTALYVERRENCPEERNEAATNAQRAYWKAKEIIKLKNYSDVESLLMVGELELSMGDYESAKISLTMALSKDAEQKADEKYVNTAKPNTDLGILYMRTGNCKEAIRFFQKAIEIDPTDLALRSNLAEAYLRDERLDDAEKEFLRVLKTAPDHIESRIGLAAVYSALGDAGDTDMYDAAVTQYSTALLLAKRKAGSKRLKDSELAKVRYSRGYAYVKSYEAVATAKERRPLYNARADFRKCFKLDGDQHKAKRAVEKINKVLPRRSPQRYLEEWGPSLILALSFGVFLLFQLSLLGSLLGDSPVPAANITETQATTPAPSPNTTPKVAAVMSKPSWLNFLAKAQPVPPSEYITVTLGALLLMVASCYLPQLLKLKVPGIELEKAAVDQITTLGPVGISKPT